ncbi:DNA-binding protein inhibitor ID-2 [Anopheles aquasalis]|uniref:DNA-binding protein inhibitor ID-2 n=1 Tax=Anopheles aquasalis TaxID=42839 RepID=UPI00215A30BB|nr:DNA-binding protein inhibitor ID-2 [Anopheles aquasalis]
MKAITAVCATGASVPAIASGRVRQRHREVENDPEIQLYLSKLKDLVPFMAKDRKMSKLEVIQNVIDYICELQNTLAHADASADASAPVEPRQPLGVRPAAPNTILASTPSSTTNSTSNSSTSNNSSSSSSSSSSTSSSSLNNISTSNSTAAGASEANLQQMNDTEMLPSC